MAVAYGTQANTGWASGTDVTNNKPSGLAVGDLMIWFLVHSGNEMSTPTGWTAFPGFITNAGSTKATWMYYKYADSSDVSGSSFSVHISSGSTLYYSIIVRVTGATNLGSSLLQSYSNTTNTQTPSFTGLTPNSRGNNLLLQFWQGANIGAGQMQDVTTYAIATSNPTWTEIVDVLDGGTDFSASVVWALRPEVTATGNFSCATGADNTTDWVGVLVSIAPAWITTVSESITMTEGWKANPGIRTAESLTMTESYDMDDSIVWSTDSKTATSWDTDDKS
jgi:hypothetical protein